VRGATRISNLAYRIAQWTDRRVEDYRYDDVHERRANAIYEVIMAQHPHRRVSPRVLGQIESYAREVLGSPRFTPWLRVYTAWAGEFKEGWIPDNYYGRVVLPAVQGPARHMAAFKTLARRMLQAGDLLPDLAYRVRGHWIDVEGRPLRASDVEDLVFQYGPRAVVKSDASNQGKGVFVVERGRDDLLTLEDAGDLSVQRLIRQHESFDRFNAGSLATVRINTLKREGEPAGWRGANLRFGRPGTEVIKSSSYVKIPVLDRHGTMADYGMLDDWTRVTRHPDSGAELEGVTIPSYEAARDACLRLHDGLSHFTFIGWDVGISDDGRFYLLEWNGIHPGIVSIEAAAGPAFTDLGWEDLWRQQA
jgi:hypothetical protein